jgi:hypothetical protein
VFRDLVPDSAPFRNEVAARVALDMVRHFPGKHAKRIPCPVLFAVCKPDTVAPSGATLRHARTAPRGEVPPLPRGPLRDLRRRWVREGHHRPARVPANPRAHHPDQQRQPLIPPLPGVAYSYVSSGFADGVTSEHSDDLAGRRPRRLAVDGAACLTKMLPLRITQAAGLSRVLLPLELRRRQQLVQHCNYVDPALDEIVEVARASSTGFIPTRISANSTRSNG